MDINRGQFTDSTYTTRGRIFSRGRFFRTEVGCPETKTDPSVHTNSVALRELVQRNVEWYSVHTNGVALREMAQRNVEWYSVDTNSVAFGRIALQNIRRWTLNFLVLLEIFRCCGEPSSNFFIRYAFLQLIPKPSLYLLIYFTSLYFWWWRPPRLSRRNHQKYKPRMEQRSAGGMTSSNVKTAAKLSHGVVAVMNSLHFALPLSRANSVSFSSFFPCRYRIYSLSFMKASIKIAMRLNSTTVCWPPGLS